MRYVLGVDQGGSKTHAVIADEFGNILGLGKARGACHSSTGMEDAMGAVVDAAAQARSQSGIGWEDISILSAGMTGVDWDYETKLIEDALQENLRVERVKVVNDCIIAMRAGTNRDNCAILCAGSGLNCAVKKGDSLFTYGFYIADEYQGGSCLGMKTVQAVLDSHIGLLPDTILTKPVLAYFKCRDVDELLYKKVKGKISSQDFLKLPILLENAAAEADKVAINIWVNYGKAITAYLIARMRMMDMLEEEADIILSGSIFKCEIGAFKDTVRSEIVKAAPGVKIIQAQYEPIVGAALLGLDELHKGKLSEAVYEKIDCAAEHFPIRRNKNRIRKLSI